VEVSVNYFDSSEVVSNALTKSGVCQYFVIYLEVMKRVALLLVTWLISLGALAFTPDQFATQVLQKDLPRSLRWFGKIVDAQQMGQVEVYNLYQDALPLTQVNQQLGISVKGSVERLILMLDGARYYDQVQRAPLEYQNKKDALLHVLQVTKDELDRFQYGEDPQVLLEEWRSLNVTDIAKFTADLVEIFMETQRLITSPVVVEAEGVEVVATESEVASSEEVAVTPTPSPAESAPTLAVAPASTPVPTPTPFLDSFETQRFNSYVQNAENGSVAGECKSAQVWRTDQAESCQSDDTLECDRSYARQCKKLQ